MSVAKAPTAGRDAGTRASDAPQSVAPQQAWPTAGVLGAAFVLLLLLAAWWAAFAVGRWSAADEALRAEEALSSRVQRDAAGVGELLDDALGLLTAVAAHDEWHAALDEPRARAVVAAAVRRAWPTKPAVAWVDDRGRVVIAAGDLQEGEDVSAQRWFVAASRGPGLATEDGVLRAVAPVHDAARRTAGVLSATIGCAAVGARLRDDPAAPRTGWALLERQGQVLCAQEGLQASLPALLPQAGPEWVRGSDGADMLLATARVAGSAVVNAQAWRLLMLQPAQTALPQAQRRTARVWMAAGGAAAFALPLVWLLARRLARPLRELAQALDQAREQYEYDPRRIPVRGTREAVAVGRAARAMLGQIAMQQALVDDSATGYRELFALHPLPMWVVDEESLRFLEVNHAAASMYGWRRDEFLAMTVLDIQPEETRAAVRAAFEDTRGQEHHAAVWPHRVRSGALIDVEVVSRQLRWGGRAARIMAVLDVTQQRRASVQLHRQRRELSQLARRLMDSEEAERRELAQVLHDRFSPTLYGSKLSLEALQARAAAIDSLPALRAEIARTVTPLVQALDASIADTRGLMSDLRPPLLVERGLAPALAHEVERQQHLNVELVFRQHDADAPCARTRDVALDYALFMIAQQALNNALQHAQAQRITLEIEEGDARVDVRVQDDGRGFDSRAAPPPGHLGLVGMHERARWIGAVLTIDSAPGAGTAVRVEWLDNGGHG